MPKYNCKTNDPNTLTPLGIKNGSRSNWKEFIKRYPVKATGAPNIIATTLGFPKVKHYQNKVLALLRRSEKARNFLLSLFPELIKAINQ